MADRRVGTGAHEMRPRLRLRPLREGDEDEFVAAHHEMAERDGFVFGLGYEDGMRWQEYLLRLAADRRGELLPDGFVPATFLVAEVDETIVGRTSIRHQLNDFLLRESGHIGFGVLPAHRRRGYATEILCQSLVVARALGIDRVLVTCDEGNVASAKTIERCGGVLESVVPTGHGRAKQRHWID